MHKRKCTACLENHGAFEGKVERKIKIEKTMKNAGMNQDVVRQLTGLDKDEIDKLFTGQEVLRTD